MHIYLACQGGVCDSGQQTTPQEVVEKTDFQEVSKQAYLTLKALITFL